MSTVDEGADWESIGRRALDEEYSRFFDEEVVEALEDYTEALRNADTDEREAFITLANRSATLLKLILGDLDERGENLADVGSAKIAAAQLAEAAEEIAELETDLERVRNEKQKILEAREERKELVRYAEEERTASERWRKASLGQRLKWRITGMPDDD